MKYYFPIHIDGGNRGCEGIAKGTALLLGKQKDQLVGLCRDVSLDQKLGVDKYVSLVSYKKTPFVYKICNKFIALLKKFHICKQLNYKEFDQISSFVSSMNTDDVMVSTGGDMMCYGDDTPSVSSVLLASKKGLSSILWGCSMGEENLTSVKELALRKFSLIYVRESLSYDFMRKCGLKHLVCLPDPAFVLEPEKVQLPKCFCNGDVVGINLSNFTIGSDNMDTPFGKEVCQLLSYIIEKTNKHILLIPHVFWAGQDDRLICEVIVSNFTSYKNRISVLKSENLNYLQIRYVISKCWCFIGARTHAVISAYSMCVPAIALGYSIKARGIAKDLGLSDLLVVDCKNSQKQYGLLQSFAYLSENYEKIKDQLKIVMPNYKKKAYEIREYL